MFPISAVTGRGVREAVSAVRAVLDELGPAEVAPETDALNITEVPRRFAPEVSTAVWYCMFLCVPGTVWFCTVQNQQNHTVL